MKNIIQHLPIGWILLEPDWLNIDCFQVLRRPGHKFFDQVFHTGHPR